MKSERRSIHSSVSAWATRALNMWTYVSPNDVLVAVVVRLAVVELGGPSGRVGLVVVVVRLIVAELV